MQKQDDGSVLIEKTPKTQYLIRAIEACDALETQLRPHNKLLITTRDNLDAHNTMRFITLSLTP